MNRVLGWSKGYTVVETMIFLAVSGLMFVSAMFLINGKQQKTEFSQAVREFDSKLQDTINNVATGLYTNTGNLVCNASPGNQATLTEVAGPDQQGKNSGCIYIGQIMGFEKDTGKIKIYSIAGTRQTAGVPPKEVTNILDAKPVAIAPGLSHSPGAPNATEDYQLGASLIIKKVVYENPVGGPQIDIDAAGFFTTFAGYNSAGNIKSGSINTQILALTSTTFVPGNDESTVDNIDDALNPPGNFQRNPAGGVKICLLSTATDQVAIVTIGSRAGTSTQFNIQPTTGGTCPPTL